MACDFYYCVVVIVVVYLPSCRILFLALYNTLHQNTEVEVEKYRQRIEKWNKTNGGTGGV